MKTGSWVGKALTLALFSVVLAGCGRSGVHPQQVESGALQAAIHDPQARAFYQAREWRAAWDRKSEKALVAAIGQAPANGLKPDLFLKGELPRDPTAREAALTTAALRYASALARGYVDPTRLGRTYSVPRPNPNVAAGLAQALQQGRLGDWLGSLAPQTDEYRALSQAHLQYLRLAAKAKAAPVPAGKPIKPGRRDPRVPLLAAALVANGYLAPPPDPKTPPPQRYQGALVAAVRQLQSDYGFKPDGVIGGDTLAALNGGPGQRAGQLAVALERLRWLDRGPPDTRIDVNTAATLLDYWRGGRLVDRRRVVAGEPGKWDAPEIRANLFQLVVNPMWRVPDRIVADEMADKGSGYFAKNNIVIKDGRYVQLSGPKNSLGLVKFDMDDKQQIYLHDTPAKALFGLPERHRSHGCVRVENALDFAAMIAAEDNVLDKFQQALATGEENYVKLRTPIPVRLLYRTAFLDGGRVQFRPDVYGWDDDVALALGFERSARQAAGRQQPFDVGP